MYCENCGTKLDDNAKFCSECGQKIEIVESEAVFENTTDIHFDREGENSADSDVLPEPITSDSEVQSVQFGSIVAIEETEPAPLADNSIGTNAQTNFTDRTCPYCHSDDSAMYIRNVTNVKQSGFSIMDAICGAMCFGPFGLLCGLCGMGQEVDIKNETWFNCKHCGGQFRSRSEAINVVKTSGTSAWVASLICSCLISLQMWIGVLNAATVIMLIIMAAFWYTFYSKAIKNLGYPLNQLFSDEQRKEYVYIIVGTIAAALLLTGPIGRLLVG